MRSDRWPCALVLVGLACSAHDDRPATAIADPKPTDPTGAPTITSAASTASAATGEPAAGSGSAGAKPDPAAGSSAAKPDPAADSSAAKPAARRAPRVELTFVGDLMFGGYFDNHYDPQAVELHDPLVDVDSLIAGDLVLGNLETTITRKLPNNGGPHDGVGHKRFVTIPERVAVLPRHRITTVTLANNHQLDNDAKGLTETVEILGELGVAYVGAARAEAPRFRVETLVVKGWKVGVIAASTQINRSPPKTPLVPYTAETTLRGELVPVIEAARANHDLIVVVLHWGQEYVDAPSRWQIDAAHAFVDAGADAVIGHHPHVLQGIERYRGAVIAYSLGNFVFPNAKERIRDTGVLRLAFAESSTPGRACLDAAAFHPAFQVRGPLTHPVLPTPGQRDEVAQRLFSLSAAAPLATKWQRDGDRFVVPAACPK